MQITTQPPPGFLRIVSGWFRNRQLITVQRGRVNVQRSIFDFLYAKSFKIYFRNHIYFGSFSLSSILN